MDADRYQLHQEAKQLAQTRCDANPRLDPGETYALAAIELADRAKSGGALMAVLKSRKRYRSQGDFAVADRDGIVRRFTSGDELPEDLQALLPKASIDVMLGNATLRDLDAKPPPPPKPQPPRRVSIEETPGRSRLVEGARRGRPGRGRSPGLPDHGHRGSAGPGGRPQAPDGAPRPRPDPDGGLAGGWAAGGDPVGGQAVLTVADGGGALMGFIGESFE